MEMTKTDTNEYIPFEQNIDIRLTFNVCLFVLFLFCFVLFVCLFVCLFNYVLRRLVWVINDDGQWFVYLHRLVTVLRLPVKKLADLNVASTKCTCLYQSWQLTYNLTDIGIIFPLMNSFNKTEAATFPYRLCFLTAFHFISLIIPRQPFLLSLQNRY